MSVEELKKELIGLSPEEQRQISAFLFHLRRSADPEYQHRLNSRLADKDPSHWLTPEEFEKRLNSE